MRERVFTPGEKAWLVENYPHRKDYFIRRHLHISQQRLDMVAEEMGLQKVVITRNALPKQRTSFCVSGSNGYCLDCAEYKEGGICRKTGKVIGALWRMNCFTKGGEIPPYS